MTERRLAPLSALSTLTRRPTRVDVRTPPAGTATSAPTAGPSRVIDNAVYSDGRRVATPASPEESREELLAGEDRLAWLGLYRPEPQELGALAELFDLPELAVEDAIKAHQRPKFERYGGTLFVVLKAARYRDEIEEVEFGELQCSSAPTSPSPSGTASRPTSRGCAGGWRASPRCWPRAARRCSTRPSTPSWTATPRWSPGWPTTSTRSRPRSSAVTRASRGASTSCRRRSWSSSGRHCR